MFVTIKRRPIGEAPEWVRDAWIGMRLPVAEPKQRSLPTVGVLTGPHSALKQLIAWASGRTNRLRGFVIDANTAVDLLAVANPAAADWWKSNAPGLLSKRRNLVFDLDACALEGE